MIRKQKFVCLTVMLVAMYIIGYVGQFRLNPFLIRSGSDPVVVGSGSWFPLSFGGPSRPTLGREETINHTELVIHGAVITKTVGKSTDEIIQPGDGAVNAKPAGKSTDRFFQAGAANVNSAESTDRGFQAVDDKNQTYVYSAYFDHRAKPIIRVLVITKDNLAPDIFLCIPDGTPGATVYDATLEYIPEPKWNYLYRGGIINCIVKDNQKPKSISVVLKSSGRNSDLNTLNNTNPSSFHKITNLLHVNYPGESPLRNITRCVPCFHNFTDTIGLVQMIEADRLFGMEHFIFYNYTGLSSKVSKLLESYQKEGVVTVKKWNLPIDPRNIHYYGQMTNSHECLYHNMWVSKYVFLADVDEIVVSDVFNSWQRMCDAIFGHHPKCGAISFRNAFFPTFFDNTKTNFDVKEAALKLNLTFLTKTIHTSIHRIGDRSKLLTKPETIRFLWIHGVDSFYDKSSTTCPVNSPRDALLHHYRSKKAPDMRFPYKDDTSIFKYSKELVNRVKAHLASIKV